VESLVLASFEDFGMDTSTWIAIITAIAGVFGALLKIVWDLSQKRLETIETAMNNLVPKGEIEALKKALDDMEEQLKSIDTEHDANAERLNEIIENLRESLADARETIAGFGSTYVTRKEFYEDRKG
jgi:division protein CdvB (Snf7/Vps24/ESCRT-III family)